MSSEKKFDVPFTQGVPGLLVKVDLLVATYETIIRTARGVGDVFLVENRKSSNEAITICAKRYLADSDAFALGRLLTWVKQARTSKQKAIDKATAQEKQNETQYTETILKRLKKLTPEERERLFQNVDLDHEMPDREAANIFASAKRGRPMKRKSKMISGEDVAPAKGVGTSNYPRTRV